MTTIESGSASHFPEGIDGEPSSATKLKGTVDSASDAAKSAIGTVSQAVDDATPMVKQGIDQAQTLMDQSLEAIRNATQALRDKADDMSEQVADYTREEPMKALLIAAAVGAGLMALLGLMMRSDD